MNLSDYGAFRSAIEASPDDEALRHVFADWLEERGQHEEAEYHRKFIPAKRWLQEFASGCKILTGWTPEGGFLREAMSYNDLLQAADDWTRLNRQQMSWYFSSHDSDEAAEKLDDPETRRLFWEHWSTVTGQVNPEPDAGDGRMFSCGCR